VGPATSAQRLNELTTALVVPNAPWPTAWLRDQ